MMARCDCVILPKSGKDTDNLVYVGPIVRRSMQIEKHYVTNWESKRKPY